MWSPAESVTDDGVLVDTGQAAGLANAKAFHEAPQDIKDFVWRQPRIEEGRALAFREACLAGAHSRRRWWCPWWPHTVRLPWPRSCRVGAVGVLAAEQREFVHGIL